MIRKANMLVDALSFHLNYHAALKAREIGFSLINLAQEISVRREYIMDWREKLQGEKVHFWAGVVAGVKDNIIVWIAVGGKNVIDPDHNYGGWFCDTLELHAQRLRIHSREHFATDDLAREVTMDEIVRTFHKITWGSARNP